MLFKMLLFNMLLFKSENISVQIYFNKDQTDGKKRPLIQPHHNLIQNSSNLIQTHPHEPFDQFGDFRQHVTGAQLGQRHRRFQDRPLPRPVPAFHRGHQGSFDLVDQGGA
jgi:hypothetical protein